MEQPQDESSPPELSASELESAYLRALEVFDAVEWSTVSTDTEETEAVEEAPSLEAPALPPAAQKTVPAVEATPEPALPYSTHQVLEAVLFVGGAPQTAKKLAHLLGGRHDHSTVEQSLDEMNATYTAEQRPYEIRLGEGGYRLMLRPEFESIRNRVYGVGPREVKLSQEALEVLALVAYRQPVTVADVEAYGKKNAGNLLRQLLRRELVCLQRSETARTQVAYRTTSRFLSLFGLGNLDELPQLDDVENK